jgi:hypothetical protein
MKSFARSLMLAPFLVSALLTGCAVEEELGATDEPLESGSYAICASDDPEDCPRPLPSTTQKGAPQASANPDSTLPLWIINGVISGAFDDEIKEYNSGDNNGSIGWRGPKFADCTTCSGPFQRPAAWPYASSYGNIVKLKFSGSKYGVPIHRDIDVFMTINATCEGWTAATGRGTMKINVYPASVQVSGSGWLEDVIDFFQLGRLSASIDDKVRAKFEDATGRTDDWGPCRSVSAQNRAGIDDDAIVWDVP